MSVDWEATKKKYIHRVCFGGIDLSAVKDLTVWVLIFPDADDWEQLDILCQSWVPEAQLVNPKNRYRDQYAGWVREGWLTATSGNAIDYDLVRAAVKADAQIFDIQSVAIDRLFQGYEFEQKLNTDLGGHEKRPRVFPCGMGFLSMAPLTKEFETRLLKKKLNHGHNPVLTFCADNVAVRMDTAGNLKPDKTESQGKIDAIVGILLALDRVLRQKKPEPPPLPSFM